MSDVALRVREYGTVSGVHSGTLEEATAIWKDAAIRVLPQIIAEEFESDIKFPQVHTAMERQIRIYRAARMGR